MRDRKLFDRDFSFPNPLMDFRFLRALQPELDRFLDHRFRVLRGFTLTNNPQLRTVRDIPTVIAWLNDSRELRKLHEKKVIAFFRFAPARRGNGGMRNGEWVPKARIED
jgi:hypothetical protein